MRLLRLCNNQRMRVKEAACLSEGTHGAAKRVLNLESARVTSWAEKAEDLLSVGSGAPRHRSRAEGPEEQHQQGYTLL
ncbi:hypothetical protein NDU88_003539 [Pleurodeles waltl]|uniref:Uncharacterized protein n=1 Tax=Pleurodeles waltl TaxID=8319 RepID=A0AAV7UGF6_PLEWA|nr:hypothetical protein NDU88_003539 [Pleurodeles waltl]